MVKSKRKIGPLLIILAGCFWGSMGIFVRKLASYGFTSVQIVSIRVTLAALILSGLLLARDRSGFRISLRDLPLFLGLGLGSILAFPGSMFGALLCGLAYKKTKNLLAALLGEVIGTAILGGLCAYPLAILFHGQYAGSVAFYVYIMPFFVSTAAGACISGIVLYHLQKSMNGLRVLGKH